MRRILYIDYLTQRGHIMFNRIQIQALLADEGISIDLIVRDSFDSYLDFRVTPLYSLPSKFYRSGRIGSRLCLIWVQFWLYRKINFKCYDYVIFSSYDALTFWMMPKIRNRVFLFNHNNIARYDNKIERCYAKRIQKDAVHLVFNDYMEQRMYELGFKNVKVVQHGLDAKKKTNTLLSLDYLEGSFSKIIFIPSSSSSDKQFIQSLINSVSFQAMLKSKNILLFVKGDYILSGINNIRVLNGWLSKEKYDSLFIKADLILLLYHPDFRYRISGVLFECFAGNKKCLMSDTPNFRVYQDYICYNAYTLHNIDSVMEAISRILDSGINGGNLYKHIEELQPQWDAVID